MRLRLVGLSLLATWCFLSTQAYSTPTPNPTPALHKEGRQLSPPRLWHKRPPTTEQAKFMLPDSRVIIGKSSRPPLRRTITDQCKDMNELAAHRGADLVSYLTSLPQPECVYGLFSLSPSQASTIYQSENLNAVAQQFTIEAQRYDGSNAALVMLSLYLRAGYYLVDQNTLPALDPAVLSLLRPSLHTLARGTALYLPNQYMTTAQEVLLLIVNTHDELNFLDDMLDLIHRYTANQQNPDAAQAVREASVARAMVSALTVFYRAHDRGPSSLSSDYIYTGALYRFVTNNRAGLIGTESEFLLGDAARESMRFMQYPALKTTVATEARDLLANNNMTGPGNEIWLAAATAVKSYDNEHCADYGVCGFETRLADAVLSHNYSCSPTIKMRAQEMNTEQFQSACQLLGEEEIYFHRMLKTLNRRVADDLNKALEVVVFDDYDNYSKYASVIYNIDTNNGGMYEEGNPADPNNQARFIAHEASWLRPAFSIWNLQHEYIHYLDGRFDMYGDFARSTRLPTVWWIEGLAEYLSLRDTNPKAINAAKTGQYKLSQIFGNTYNMPDYVNRAYNWGYVATRFMFERHKADVTAVVARFRRDQYDDYWDQMRRIGTRYDDEFAQWLASLSTQSKKPTTTPRS